MKKIKEKKTDKGYTILTTEEKEYTNGDYIRLGDRLRNHTKYEDIDNQDLEILQTLRTSYKTPLSEIFGILQKSISKVNPNAIVTYRIKRIDSIISKLHRLPGAQLPRIEDIAGCRCILKSNSEVYQLKEILQEQLYIKSDRNDYIASPKSDGYKSLHLIVQTKDQKSRPIEIQLRCEKDHNWATLVEITDLIYNTRIKEIGNEAELGKMLLLLSKGFDNIETHELKTLIYLIESTQFIKKINSVFVSNSINIRKQWSQIEGRRNKSFYLIEVDKKNNSFINSYENFNEAEKAYFNKFKNNREHNIVLTHIPNARFEQISKAYSNYTLTYHDFFNDLSRKCKELVKISFAENRVSDFKKYFSLYTFIYFEFTKLQIYEFFAMTKTSCKKMKSTEWQKDIQTRLKRIEATRKETFNDIKVNKFNLYHLQIMFIRKRIWQKNANLANKDLNEFIKEHNDIET